MAGLRKPVLYRLFEGAMHQSGWTTLVWPAANDFPARYQLTNEPLATVARVYIWTITHGGGKARAKTEYRIQLTNGSKKLAKFVAEPNGKTLILGWWPEAAVFAGFDYNHHKNALGNSPSIQVGEDALRLAAKDGMAVHVRGNKEIVIAFRPEFLGTYVAQTEDLHRIGTSQKAVHLLTQLTADPSEKQEEEIGAEHDKTTARVMASVLRAVRASQFSAKVLTAYGNKCAFCGVQLKLLDAAHILPVAHPGGVDLTANGLALCTLHHRAYDNSLITFDADFRIHVNTDQIEKLKKEGLVGGVEEFSAALRKKILLPKDASDHPKPAIIQEANQHRGWKLKLGKPPSKKK